MLDRFTYSILTLNPGRTVVPGEIECTLGDWSASADLHGPPSYQQHPDNTWTFLLSSSVSAGQVTELVELFRRDYPDGAVFRT
ncbi:hypothetical protein [Deinococcus knuensis]|uniref:Uncharacterized protein n=1 Tax=Deinococcus knuensis TaxID=1837380 RepID=A0ABQ2SNS8_9DEIO|nr:hypothetical protein [Deinococcus knuensis]GGS35458.1 hypothetical protein GCM10008961_28930 [Deinococcus knuensis]